MTLLRWLTFLLGSLTVTLTVLLFWIYFFSDTSICSTMAFPPLGNSDHVFVSVSIYFPINSKWDAPFHRIAYNYSHADWDGPCDHLRDVSYEDIFNFSASAAASKFCAWQLEGVQPLPKMVPAPTCPPPQLNMKKPSAPPFTNQNFLGPPFCIFFVAFFQVSPCWRGSACHIVSGFRLALVYIPHRKNQIKLHSFPWFSVPCATAIVHRNHFFLFLPTE